MTPTPDHQMTPQHETSTPAEDHPSTSTTKITEPITPMHHDPTVIHFSVADAPSQLIWPALGGPAPQQPGRRWHVDRLAAAGASVSFAATRAGRAARDGAPC